MNNKRVLGSFLFCFDTSSVVWDRIWCRRWSVTNGGILYLSLDSYILLINILIGTSGSIKEVKVEVPVQLDDRFSYSLMNWNAIPPRCRM